MENIVVLHYPDERQANWELLSKASRKRGIRLLTWEPHRLQLYCADSRFQAYYDGRRENPEVILHRTVSPFQGIVVPALGCWAAEGTRVLNEPAAAYRSRDKLLTTLALCRAHVPIVRTLALFEADETALRVIGDQEVILKPAYGTRGEGILTAGSARELAALLDDGRDISRQSRSRAHYVVQPLVRGGGRDVRAFVVDGVCVALMQRTARLGEVRANLALGAVPTRLPPAHPAAGTAVAAVAACQLDYGGVDLIEDDQGDLRVLEVDAWAGFAGITAATGADVAGAILDLAIRRLRAGPSA